MNLKKWLGYSSFYLVAFLFFPLVLQAQTAPVDTQNIDVTNQPTDVSTNDDTDNTTPKEEKKTKIPLEAKAGKDRNVLVGRTVLFDASSSTGPENKELVYHWDFGDNASAEGIDATHVYATRGTYRVILTVKAGREDNAKISEDEIIVSVQDRLMMLMTDQSVAEQKIADLQSYALTQGTLLISIRDSGVDQEYLTVQNLAQQMIDHQEDVRDSSIIITWTAGNVGFNSLVELARISSLNNAPLEDFNFDKKAIVSINDNVLVSTAKIAQTTFGAIAPQYIIVANSAILDNVISAQSSEKLQEQLSGVDANYQIITDYTARGIQKLSIFNVMSYAMNFMINKGVPINSLFLLLMLPIMATIIAVARQIIGVKAFGIFVPTVVALSFLATGIKYGVIIFIFIIIVGTIARIILRRFRLLYLPRMALVLSLLALSVFLMFFVGAYFNKTGFIAVSIFPILIMTVLTEQFIAVQIEQGFKNAIKLTLETLVLSIIGYLIGDWAVFKSIILAYPELILLTLVINYLVGKFSGLRFTEYIRFRKVFKHMSHVEKSK